MQLQPLLEGVGGGIVAVVPDRLSLCVGSPALELFTAKTGLSIF